MYWIISCFHQLAEPLDLSVPSAKPITLPLPIAEFDPPAGFRVNVSGWGTTTV